MAFHLDKAIFINRAPFEHLELDFKKNGINVLTAINGKGKTTILSHIVDAFYELARPYFENEFEGKSNKYYRISSSIFNLNLSLPSFVYFVFNNDGDRWDYIDIRNECSENDYEANISIDNKIPYNEFSQELKVGKNVKKWCNSAQKDSVIKLFNQNLLTFFPSYRYESPGYLSDTYSFKIEHKIESGYSGFLTNPLRVICQFKVLANWLLDVVLDEVRQSQKLLSIGNQLLPLIKKNNANVNSIIEENEIPKDVLLKLISLSSYSQQEVLKNINQVISNLLSSKYPQRLLKVGVGDRAQGGTRINIVDASDETVVYPSIFNMSSGEKALVSIFVELLRQMDNLRIKINDISGIVLIDEIDKNLHISMQHEILPKLLNMFPNVQFIVTSHSPFLIMGLAHDAQERAHIIDLDNDGLVCELANNEQFKELCSLVISEDQVFANRYIDLKSKMKTVNKPVVISEGKTDWKHFKAALNHFKELGEYTDLDVEILEYDFDFGDSKLHTLLNQYKMFPHRYKVIGIFDCDEDNGKKIHKAGGIREYGNNVWGMSIPIPEFRSYNTEGISIEFLYKDDVIKCADVDGRRLYVTSEFNENGRLKTNPHIGVVNIYDVIKNLLPSQEKVLADGVIDINGNSLALSKEQFAKNILYKNDGFENVDFEGFRAVFDRLMDILQY